jgi:hypothetical protein
MQGRDQDVVPRAGQLAGIARDREMDPGLHMPGPEVRGVVMSNNRPPVLDVALVALLVALAFDALSTALVWGLIRHLPS